MFNESVFIVTGWKNREVGKEPVGVTTSTVNELLNRNKAKTKVK